MESKEEYYISRFKSIILNANKIGLLFIFTIIYVWFKSVEPNYSVLKNQLTLNNQSLYFDTIYYNLHSNNSKKLEHLYITKKDTRLKKFDSVNNKLNHIAQAKQLKPDLSNVYAFSKKDTFYTRAVRNNQARFNENKSIKRIKRITDSLKTASSQSLTSSQIKIDVPTLNSIEFKLNVGIPIWMCMTTFFMLFMYTSRNNSFKYLIKAFHLYSGKKTSAETLNHLDINIPFWLYPFNIYSDYNEDQTRQILNKYDDKLKTTFTIFCILLILSFQLATAFFILNLDDFWETLNNSNNNYSIFLSKLISFGTSAVSIIISLLWLLAPKQINLSLNIANDKINQHPGRRRFIVNMSKVLGVGVIILPFKQFRWLTPRMEGETFNYRRKKPAKKSQRIIKNFSGFYINIREKSKTIHYFDQHGYSLTLKTIPAKREKAFIQNLKKIEIINFIEDIKKNKARFPHSIWAFENAAELDLKNYKFNEALFLLQKSTEINFYTQSRERLTHLFKTKLKTYGEQLTLRQRQGYNKFAESLNNKSNYLNKYLNSNKV